MKNPSVLFLIGIFVVCNYYTTLNAQDRVDIYHHQARTETMTTRTSLLSLGLGYFPKSTYYLFNDETKTNTGGIFSAEFSQLFMNEEADRPGFIPGYSIGFMMTDEVKPEWYIFPELGDDFTRRITAFDFNACLFYYFNNLFKEDFSPFAGISVGPQVTTHGAWNLNLTAKAGIVYKNIGIELGYRFSKLMSERDGNNNAIVFKPGFCLRLSYNLTGLGTTTKNTTYD